MDASGESGAGSSRVELKGFFQIKYIVQEIADFHFHRQRFFIESNASLIRCHTNQSPNHSGILKDKAHLIKSNSVSTV